MICLSMIEILMQKHFLNLRGVLNDVKRKRLIKKKEQQRSYILGLWSFN